MSTNDRRLYALKNKYPGGRCFIVGNGPSLCVEDLDKLKEELTFASNDIGLAFSDTDWRPTFYTAVETSYVMQNSENIRMHLENSCVFLHQEVLRNGGYFKNALYYRYIWEEVSDDWVPSFGRDPFRGIYWGSTCTYNHLQFALYMGFKKIYLVGVDCNYPGYTGPAEGDEPVSIDMMHGRGHFHPNYRGNSKSIYPPNINRHIRAYERAKKEADRKGVLIANATRGGNLEVFDRIQFDELFPMASDKGLISDMPSA
ncbi:MAG: DUF115 domain-containing protein [Kiritimatiellae bacterium]|nr:DUF115 domain-containing protein [Kiritimatiellia bacterium]